MSDDSLRIIIQNLLKHSICTLKELLEAKLLHTKQMYYYLQNIETHSITKSCSDIKDLLSQVIETPEQHTYLSKLLVYNYSIQYKIGKSNVVTDALSRAPKGPCMHISFSIPHLLFLDHLQPIDILLGRRAVRV